MEDNIALEVLTGMTTGVGPYSVLHEIVWPKTSEVVTTSEKVVSQLKEQRFVESRCHSTVQLPFRETGVSSPSGFFGVTQEEIDHILKMRSERTEIANKFDQMVSDSTLKYKWDRHSFLME